MENGPPGQIHLSFALALLPAALTVFITIQTVEIQNNRISNSYWIAFWLPSVQGLIALGRWWTTSASMKMLTRDIRSRMPEKPGITEQLAGPARGNPSDPGGA